MKTSLGDRIKSYERVSKHFALLNMPLVIRVDGKAFHTFTKRCEKPFDKKLIHVMTQAARYTAKRMQGFKAAYVQSDEVTFVLTDYDSHETSAWFDYELPKLISTSAAIMSVSFFNEMENVNSMMINENNLPTFDSRAFNVPKHDVINTFLWRALDWKRNSVQMLAQANFSHKELQGKNQNTLKEMLLEINEDWNLLKPEEKYGTFIVQDTGGLREFHVEPTYSEIQKIMINFENLGE